MYISNIIMTLIKRINNKKSIIILNISAIGSLVTIYLIGMKYTNSVTSEEFKLFLLVLATWSILMSMFITYVSIPSNGTGTTFTFVLSIINTMVSFAIAFAMIYYIGLSSDLETFRFYNSEKEVLMFFDFFYYSVVTFTTLGYGDITPVSFLAKLYTIIETLIFVVYISMIVLNFSNIKSNKEE